MSLTVKQQIGLRFIDGYIRRTGGTSPSLREIASALGVKSHTCAFRVLHGLQDRGFLTFKRRIPRSITLLKRPDALEDPRDGVVVAARELLKTIRAEQPGGLAMVSADAIGDLDVALAEMDAAK